MICPGCGAQNPEDAGFCSLCLQSFENPQPPGQMSQQGFDPGYVPQGLGAPPPPAGPQPHAPGASAFAAHPTMPPVPPAPPPVRDDRGGFSHIDPEELKPVDVMPPAPPPLMPNDSGFQPPPSEWGAQPYSPAYGQPPPPVVVKRNAMSSPVGRVMSVIIIVIFFAVGYFGTDYVLTKRLATYDSKVSDLRFQYPAGWKKLSTSDFVGGSDIIGLVGYNEIMLADSTSDNMKYLMGTGSVPLAPEEWPSTKADIAQRFAAGTSDPTLAASDTTMTTPSFSDTAVGRSSAMEIKYKMTAGGYDFNCHAVVVSNRSTMYFIFFMTRGDPESTAGQVQKVLDSLEFKSPVT